MISDEMSLKLAAEIEKLRVAIRKHRDQRGDDRCWLDDEELYKVLPEGYTPPERDTSVELHNCEQFIACRHNPATVYVSPEIEIARLREEVATLKKELAEFTAKEGLLNSERSPEPLRVVLVYPDGRIVSCRTKEESDSAGANVIRVEVPF